VAAMSRSLNAPETMNNTAKSTRPKVINAGMVGLTGTAATKKIAQTTDRVWALSPGFSNDQ
jgi:TPP-dependent trihydroxycyclohexane-1,2-dione (THcHDO) dehydratase